jgi:hypothetical protein
MRHAELSCFETFRPLIESYREAPAPPVVDRPGIFHRRVDPRPDHLQHEEAVALDHAAVRHPTLQIDEALLDKRRIHLTRGNRRESEFGEPVNFRARAVAAFHHLFGQLDRRDRNHALAVRTCGGNFLLRFSIADPCSTFLCHAMIRCELFNDGGDDETKRAVDLMHDRAVAARGS